MEVSATSTAKSWVKSVLYLAVAFYVISLLSMVANTSARQDFLNFLNFTQQ